MAKFITTLLAVGVIVGVVGGIAHADRWFYLGELIVLVGVVVLYALAIWKNPYEIARRRRWRAEADAEARFPEYPQQKSTDHQQSMELPSNGRQT